MAPPLVQLKDIALTFGGTPLLAGVELSVSDGERVCLVGRNGSGKSTLLKIAAGLIEPDRGTRFLQPGATVRYLPQEPDFAGAATTLAYVEAGLGPGDDRHRRAICWSSSGSTATKTRPTSPAARPGGPRWRACSRPPPTSCCSTSRPTISTSPPSNGWSSELAGRRAAMVMISHDRRFLANLSRSTIWLDRGADAPDRARLCRLREPGATRCWPRKSANSTSSTARSSPRSIGCATASPRAASATSAGSAPCMRCGEARRDYRAAAGQRRSCRCGRRPIRHAGDRG